MLWYDKMKAGGLAILLGLSTVLSGCSQEVDAGEKLFQSGQVGAGISAPQGMETPETEAPDTNGKETSQASQALNNTSFAVNDTDVREIIPLTELPEHVFQTNDGKLLLLGDKAVLMDIDTYGMEICKEMTGLDFSFQDIQSCKFVQRENEYLVAGNYHKLEKDAGENFFTSSDEPRLMLIRFSNSLEVLETLDIGEAMGAQRGIDKYDFIDHGRKLLCSSMEGFFLYDLETGARTQYSLDDGLLGINTFGYMEAENKILFTAFYNNGSQADSLNVLGSLHLDGTDLEYEKKQTHEWGEIWSFEDFALIEDGKWNADGERASAFCYRDGKIQEWALADEYAAIQASETGKYFAVQSRDWAENGNNTGYTVRVYETEGGRLMQEISCPFSETGQDTMLCQCVVSEKAEAVFLLMCDRETKKDARFQVLKL